MLRRCNFGLQFDSDIVKHTLRKRLKNKMNG